MLPEVEAIMEEVRADYKKIIELIQHYTEVMQQKYDKYEQADKCLDQLEEGGNLDPYTNT